MAIERMRLHISIGYCQVLLLHSLASGSTFNDRPASSGASRPTHTKIAASAVHRKAASCVCGRLSRTCYGFQAGPVKTLAMTAMQLDRIQVLLSISKGNYMVHTYKALTAVLFSQATIRRDLHISHPDLSAIKATAA